MYVLLIITTQRCCVNGCRELQRSAVVLSSHYVTVWRHCSSLWRRRRRWCDWRLQRSRDRCQANASSHTPISSKRIRSSRSVAWWRSHFRFVVATEPEVGETGKGEQRRTLRNRTFFVLVAMYCIGTVKCVGTFMSRRSSRESEVGDYTFKCGPCRWLWAQHRKITICWRMKCTSLLAVHQFSAE